MPKASPKEDRQEVVRRTMQAIRSKDTKAELALRRALHAQGVRYRTNNRALYGTPDVSIKGKKLAIFVDSCFWHKCPTHFRMPKANPEYWVPKFERNLIRDERVNKHYIDNNWKLLRFWEHDIQHDLEGVIARIKTVL